MKTQVWSLSVLSAAVLSIGIAVANPLPVRTLGTKSQTTEMCPNCKEKVSCAKVGDYTIGFTADVDNVKAGTGKVTVHVKDKARKPVNDAKVVVALDMPKHGHDRKPLKLKSAGHGAYEAPTNFGMPGEWKAEVQVTPAGGDTVKQSFSFRK